MRRSEVTAFLASLLWILLVVTPPVSAQPGGGSEGGVDADAPSAEVFEYYGSPPSEDPIVVENGELRSDGFDTRVGCLSDYRVLGARQSRACYEAGYTPLNYPGPDVEGPFPPYTGPGAAAVPASPATELPGTGGAATPALLGAGALLAIAGLLVRRGTRARTRGGAARPPGGS